MLKRFNMNDAKALSVHLQPHLKSGKNHCPKDDAAANSTKALPSTSACGSLLYTRIAKRSAVEPAVEVVSR